MRGGRDSDGLGSGKATTRPWTRGSAPALLNLTGAGAGYAYLHRPLRGALYLAGAIGIVAAAYWMNGDEVSVAWAWAAAAWVVLSAADGWREGNRAAERDATPVAPSLLPALVAMLVIVTEVAGFSIYRASGQRALAVGRTAHEAGDCRAALARYASMSTIHKLTFTSVVKASRTNAGECAVFLSAQSAPEDSFAVSGYRSFLRSHPQSVLVPRARGELAQRYVDWADASAREGDFLAAVEKLEIVRDDYDETPAAAGIDELLTATQRSWNRAYQQELARLAREFRTSFARLETLGAVPRIARWFDGARSKFATLSNSFDDVAPPVAAARVHRRLVDAVKYFPATLLARSYDVRDYEVCASSSVLARLATVGWGRRLRAAPGSLRRVGFRLDLGKFAHARPTNRRLATGSFVIGEDPSGANVRTLQNQTRVDSVITLTRGSAKPEMSVYVRGNEEYTISGVLDGTYRAFITTGEDWDSKHRTFARRCAFAKSREAITLTSSATRYTVGTYQIFPGRRTGERLRAVNPARFPGGPR